MYEKQKREQMQGHSHEIWSGTVAVGGDAGKGSGIELEKKNLPSFFSYQDGLSWHLRALKTRKRRLQTIVHAYVYYGFEIVK